MGISIILTAVLYCLYPLISAKNQIDVTTAKDYRKRCFCINAIILVIFVIINLAMQENAISSVVPYGLWTTIFAGIGVKQLKSRGLIEDNNDKKDK